MPKIIDITNNIYGRLTVDKLSTPRPGVDWYGHTYWDCTCTCGSYVRARKDTLVTGRTTSCGCRRDEVAALRAITNTGMLNWNKRGSKKDGN